MNRGGRSQICYKHNADLNILGLSSKAPTSEKFRSKDKIPLRSLSSQPFTKLYDFQVTRSAAGTRTSCIILAAAGFLPWPRLQLPQKYPYLYTNSLCSMFQSDATHSVNDAQVSHGFQSAKAYGKYLVPSTSSDNSSDRQAVLLGTQNERFSVPFGHPSVNLYR